MWKKDNTTQLINQVIDREIYSLGKELRDEYIKILNDDSNRPFFYEPLVKNGNEIIKKHLNSVIKECFDFPFKMSADNWIDMQKKLKTAIEDLENEYYNELMTLKNIFPQSPSIFNESKEELELLIKESITKSNIKGFESESNYRLSSRKRANIALTLSIISILISILFSIITLLIAKQ